MIFKLRTRRSPSTRGRWAALAAVGVLFAEGSMTQEAVVSGWLARGVGGPHWWLGRLEGGWFGDAMSAARGGSPLYGLQSVIRFEVWSNKIKELRAKTSKRITLCSERDPASPGAEECLPDHVGLAVTLLPSKSVHPKTLPP